MMHLLVVWLTILMFVLPVFAGGSNVYAISRDLDGDDEDDDVFSLYYQASDLTDAFGVSNATDKDGSIAIGNMLVNGDGTNIVRTGQAGGVLGYSDMGFLSNISSSNQNSVSLGTLKASKVSIKDNEQSPALYSYAQYGLALQNAGLDEVRSSLSKIWSFLFKILYIIYTLAAAAPAAIGLMVDFLKATNPFTFFDGIAKMPMDGVNLSFSEGHESALWTNLGPVLKIFGIWITSFRELSFNIVFPLLLAIAVFSLIVLRQSAKSTLGRYAIRLFIFFLGVPIVGSVYTSALDSISNTNSETTTYFSRIVYSNFLDFRSWAINTRLGIPDELKGVITPNGLTNGKSLETVTLTLNAYALNKPSLIDLDASSTFNIDALVNTQRNDETAEGEKKEAPKKDGNDVTELLRTVSSSKGNEAKSSDFEGVVKADIQSLISKDGDGGSTKEQRIAVYKMFSIKAKDFNKDNSKGILSDKRSDKAKELLGGGQFTWDIYNTGFLGRSDNGGFELNAHVLKASEKRARTRVASLSVDNKDGEVDGAGLTPIAMYNYLNTNFNDEGSLTFDSPLKSANALIRDFHVGIVLTGDLLQRILKYILLILTFGVICYLQIRVVIAVATVAISRFATLMGNIVGTSVGSVTSFINLIKNAFVTLGVLIGTFLLYYLYASILIAGLSWVDTSTASLPFIAKAAIKVLFIILFARLGGRSIHATSKNLAAFVDEIVRKISTTFEQNWARNASLGTIGDAMPGMYGGYGGVGGGRGANSGGGKGDLLGDFANSGFGQASGLGKDAAKLSDNLKAGEAALEAENKARVANGQKPKSTKGVSGVVNKLSAGHEAKQEAKKSTKDARQKERDAKREAKGKDPNGISAKLYDSTIGKVGDHIAGNRAASNDNIKAISNKKGEAMANILAKDQAKARGGNDDIEKPFLSAETRANRDLAGTQEAYEAPDTDKVDALSALQSNYERQGELTQQLAQPDLSDADRVSAQQELSAVNKAIDKRQQNLTRNGKYQANDLTKENIGSTLTQASKGKLQAKDGTTSNDLAHLQRFRENQQKYNSARGKTERAKYASALKADHKYLTSRGFTANALTTDRIDNTIGRVQGGLRDAAKKTGQSELYADMLGESNPTPSAGGPSGPDIPPFPGIPPFDGGGGGLDIPSFDGGGRGDINMSDNFVPPLTDMDAPPIPSDNPIPMFSSELNDLLSPQNLANPIEPPSGDDEPSGDGRRHRRRR